jgi:hypothetical protein
MVYIPHPGGTHDIKTPIMGSEVLVDAGTCPLARPSCNHARFGLCAPRLRNVTPQSRRFVARWISWCLFCSALLALSLALAWFSGPPLEDWFDVILRDPGKNWIGLVLMILGGGWMLARLIH